MSHAVPVSDDLYEKLNTYAQREGQPLEVVLERWLSYAIEQFAKPEKTFVYDPANDPLAPFIGAFDSGDQPPLEPHEHDLYFAGATDAKETE